MTSKQRMIEALNRRVPDRVPTFELEFQLSHELLGRDMLRESDLKGLSPNEIERRIAENAELLVEVYDRLEHDAICIQYLSAEHTAETVRRIRQLVGDRFMLLCHGDGTFDMRMDTAHEVRRQNPEIKIALLCDNVSDESSAYKVKCAKEDGSIDAFFYESVPSDYLADAIDAL